jgi:hypothetical protein
VTTRSGRCEACGFDWDGEDPARLIAIIRSAPARFANATSRTRPAPGVWSPLEYTVHMAPALDFYTDRIELAVAYDRPQFTAFDFSAACDDERYNERDPNEALGALVEAADRLITRLETLTPSQWQRCGIGSDGDERTVKMLARRAAHEVQHHALDVRGP